MHTGLHVSLLFLPALLGAAGEPSQGWTDLSAAKDLSAWRAPTAQWQTAREVWMDPANPRRLRFRPGPGILVNGAEGKAPDLRTRRDFGDVEVHAEFLIPQHSNSGVKLMSLYEVQIYDSYGIRRPSASDCGGIYPRAELTPRYHHIDGGTPPRVNAARPAGEWQSLDIRFLAPRFDAQGKKIRNARFVRVLLNGQRIHENVEVPTPTGHAWRDPEVAVGPLLLQGDHGPVAFRNLRVRPLKESGTDSGRKTP